MILSSFYYFQRWYKYSYISKYVTCKAPLKNKAFDNKASEIYVIIFLLYRVE